MNPKPLTLISADCRAGLKEIADDSIQCCVTSPPFWGLRNYGTRPQIWGGSPACEHQWVSYRYYTEQTASAVSTESFAKAGKSNASRLKAARWRADEMCSQCGAWKGELGLEPTPELYVAHLVEVFREVRRVLKPNGVLWLNLGDTYASGGRGGNPTRASSTLQGGKSSQDAAMVKRSFRTVPGLKEKDLVGIPWMAAFALRTDGWWLRSEVIWAKPNPKPENVRDRPTRGHEHIFLLTKSPRYKYNAVAIAELASAAMQKQVRDGYAGTATKDYTATGAENPSALKARIIANARKRANGGPLMRNKRTVWTVKVRGYGGAHFATFPPELVKPCILAGSDHGDAVLDPFAGSGTTGGVALEAGRRAILIDLQDDYMPLCEARCAVTLGMAI